MPIESVGNPASIMANPGYRNAIETTPAQAGNSFSTWLNDAVGNLNETRAASDVKTEAMARGEDVDLHQVMIAGQKASIALETTVEVRNKAIEAYQEIMRMQV
ncbi:flagellar hook-basal body complex protein FliE [Alkalicoccus luteus]|uniref:Flagellar hook-basal body complex protein FliE n=1 Tax=Alkalicoccus luteus TaxID=1237094 RepID=A0A969PLF8_9BACI|nr:flagellar hook-basal body complex protein FliE [Alkalicoccus luteus]NJP36357.1 flagellar hook-basal body complex protein FliE [Alkalicoccus luteus]